MAANINFQQKKNILSIQFLNRLCRRKVKIADKKCSDICNFEERLGWVSVYGDDWSTQGKQLSWGTHDTKGSEAEDLYAEAADLRVCDGILSTVYSYERSRTVAWKVVRLVISAWRVWLKVRYCLLAMTGEEPVERLVICLWRLLIHSRHVYYLQVWQAKNCYLEGEETGRESADPLQVEHYLLFIGMTGEGLLPGRWRGWFISAWRLLIYSRWETVYCLWLWQLKNLLPVRWKGWWCLRGES